MEAFKRKRGLRRGSKYTSRLEPIEREVLGNLASSVAEALIHRAQTAPKDELDEMMGISTGHKEPPTHPGLARLLPDFEREGDEEFDGDNAMLRSLYENDICREKLKNLQVITTALGPDGSVFVTVEEDEVKAWLGGLNDIRLYLAESVIDPEKTTEEERDKIVEWLGYAQESLLSAYMS